MIYPKIYTYQNDLPLFKTTLDSLEFPNDATKKSYAIELLHVIISAPLTLTEKKTYAAYTKTSLGLTFTGLDTFIELLAQHQDTTIDDGPAGNLVLTKLLATSDVPYGLRQPHVHAFLNIVLSDHTMMLTYKADIDALILILKANE